MGEGGGTCLSLLYSWYTTERYSYSDMYFHIVSINITKRLRFLGLDGTAWIP